MNAEDLDKITVEDLTQEEITHVLLKLAACKCPTCKSISHKIGEGLKHIGEDQAKEILRNLTTGKRVETFHCNSGEYQVMITNEHGQKLGSIVNGPVRILVVKE